MNALTNLTTSKTLTMSSREIADLLDCRHDNVKVTVERLVGRGVIVQPAMQDVPLTDSLGRPRVESVYLLEKRPSYIVVAQLSPEFTAALVDRWQELEEAAKGPALPNFGNPAEAARAWALEFERAEEQARLAVEHARKVEALPSHDLEVDDVPFLARSHIVPVYAP